ncbi:MAG: zinc-ribbon domain-containing protein [Pseudomonadota bacterium]
MIISCPSCQTQFRVDEALLTADGKKVRCSKCGHVWRAMPDGQSAPSIEQPAPVVPTGDRPVADVSPAETPQAGQPAQRAEPVPSARGDIDRQDGNGDADGSESAEKSDEAESPEDEETGPDGLTEDQRAKLAAARHQKPRSRFWIKVLTIFVIVAGLLLLAQRMLPPQGLKKAEQETEQPAAISKVDANPAPADSEKGGHIVVDEPPAQ